MRKIFCLAFAIAMAASSMAHAGSANLKKGNNKMSLWCDNGGCYSKVKSKKTARLGPGGSSNFYKHKKAFKRKGWK